MNKAIQKAIEGGYGEFLENREGVYEFEQFYLKHPEKALLHPSFWQALGKAEGWLNKKGFEGWIIYWHRFIDHLAEGKDINSFFEELLSHE